jgi:ATP-dependent RNA helicase DDX10/DBP4
VKFVFEAFKKLRPGIPLKCLHGRMKQEKRMGIYSQFCESHSVLFSTDVASRGLDFNKAVDWVVQVRYLFFETKPWDIFPNDEVLRTCFFYR